MNKREASLVCYIPHFEILYATLLSWNISTILHLSFNVLCTDSFVQVSRGFVQELLISNSLISNCLAGNYNSDSSLVLGSFFCNQTLLYFVGTPIAYLVKCTVKPVWFVTCTLTKTGLQHTLQGSTLQKKAKERICSRNVHIGKVLVFCNAL